MRRLLVALLLTSAALLGQTGAAVSLTPSWIAVDHVRQADQYTTIPYCYFARNASVNGGYLTITTKAEATTCVAGGAIQETSGFVYSSAFSFLYGTAEARVATGGGTGTWPAFWLLDAGCRTPDYATFWSPCPVAISSGGDAGEIDVMETGIALGWTFYETTHLIGGVHSVSVSKSDPQGWHTHRVVWTPTQVTFSVDGATVGTVSADIPSRPVFVLLNNALGGWGGGTTVDSATLPVTMQVDYVRVWGLDGRMIFDEEFSGVGVQWKMPGAVMGVSMQ